MSIKLNTLTERQAEILRAGLEMYANQVRSDMSYMKTIHDGIDVSLAGDFYREEMEDINYLASQLRTR